MYIPQLEQECAVDISDYFRSVNFCCCFSPFVWVLFLCLSVCFSICLCFYMSVCLLSVFLYVCLSVSVLGLLNENRNLDYRF